MDSLAPAGCICNPPCGCLCPDTERALRFVQTTPNNFLLSDEQREWCLTEIGRVEGYDRKDFENAIPSDLARGVLSAWTDFCRDKGML
jgi:hypothetical protein